MNTKAGKPNWAELTEMTPISPRSSRLNPVRMWWMSWVL